jgi:hypothetical protein
MFAICCYLLLSDAICCDLLPSLPLGRMTNMIINLFLYTSSFFLPT